MTSPSTAPRRFAATRDRIDAFRQTRFWHYARWPALFGAGVVTLVLLFIVALYLTVDLPKDLPELSSSTIVDVKGREIAVLQKDGLRIETPLEDVSPVVVDALVAAEDRHFYQHGGIDPSGIARAIKNNLGGGATQGGSTLTQQLVKNSYLTHERTITRKLKEAVLAIKLERTEDKDEILERYLNTVYFGRGAYGIGAASKVYFELTPAQLQPDQAALLIGLLRAPETADPVDHPDKAKRRRDTVLSDLLAVGKLTKAEAAAEKAKPVTAKPRAKAVSLTAGVAPHFVEWVRQQAVTQFGESAVYGGGLKIITTLDLDDQHAAEDAVNSVLSNPDDPQAALVAVDRDGAIKAFVGGRNYDALNVDLARGKKGGGTGRQPGSTFKPFVLAAALENDITLGTRFPAPSKISIDNGGAPYEVDNYGGESFGNLDLTSATANSVNTVYAQLIKQVGPAKVAELAKRAGIESKLSNDLSLTLGTKEVSVLELTDAYLTFARDGEHVPTFAISRVEDPDGKVLFEVGKPKAERAMEAGPAQAVNHALQQVIAKGTGKAARLSRPVAGKTGTTQGNGDAWFAGYTPNYAAVVWMGYPEGPDHAMTDVHGVSVTGGSLPAQIWKRFMDKALADVEEADFAPPPKELLEAAKKTSATLSLSPSSGAKGDTIIANGTGYEACTAGWYLTFDPGGLQTTSETGSDADLRSATFNAPADAGVVTAWCDDGMGAQAVAKATFGGQAATSAPAPTTTSSSSTSTTSTTQKPKPKETPTTTEQPSTTTTSGT